MAYTAGASCALGYGGLTSAGIILVLFILLIIIARTWFLEWRRRKNRFERTFASVNQNYSMDS